VVQEAASVEDLEEVTVEVLAVVLEEVLVED